CSTTPRTAPKRKRSSSDSPEAAAHRDLVPRVTESRRNGPGDKITERAKGLSRDWERPFDLGAACGNRTHDLRITSLARKVQGCPETVSDLGGRLSGRAMIPELSSPVRSRC